MAAICNRGIREIRGKTTREAQDSAYSAYSAVYCSAGRSSRLAAMPLGNSATPLSRRDVMKIARRFNAGSEAQRIRVRPGGTVEAPPAKGEASADGSIVPSGRAGHEGRLTPALKRRAILGCPFGTAASDTGQANFRKALRLAGMLGYCISALRRMAARLLYEQFSLASLLAGASPLGISGLSPGRTRPNNHP